MLCLQVHQSIDVKYNLGFDQSNSNGGGRIMSLRKQDDTGTANVEAVFVQKRETTLIYLKELYVQR